MRTVIDKESNNMSLIDIVEQLQARGPRPQPGGRAAIPLNAEVVTLWSRTNNDVPVMGYSRTTLENPSGGQMIEILSDIDLTAHNRRRMRGKIELLPVPENGMYLIKVFQRTEETADWEQVAKVPLEVSLEFEGE